MRRLLALVVAGLLLSSCGTQSAATAVRSWLQNSNFTTNAEQLRRDAHQAALALRNSATSAKDLHTVCAVLSVDTLAANAALPTPDAQLSTDLAAAYNALGGAANVCYQAGASTTQRTRALDLLVTGVGGLAASGLRASVVAKG